MYPLELKKQVIEMRLRGMTKKQIAVKLGIYDVNRIKIWMRKFRADGEFSLVDQRGKQEKYMNWNVMSADWRWRI
ncbi:helix-turn-helix domain-containing protein [Tumebacillus lipolyticus]|uniref:Helix-turn-helix domain-containing protein n=1 Tax=Tumebacillus lipolyticus TaxID=1280370 RepID=A0ABW5A1A3_9BACL